MARTTYVQVKQPDGRFKYVDRADFIPPSENRSAMVIGDIQPYVSTIDGSMIKGRAQHRAHLKQHGCVEMGCDSIESSQKYFKRPELSQKERLSDVRRAYEKAEAVAEID
jgi:hypothetical protein